MNDPYVSFDTFSVGGADLSGAAGDATPTLPQRPSLLARLPRVTPEPRPKTIQRFDEAESALHGVHSADEGLDIALAGGDTATAPPPKRFLLSDPTATIRIDTVSPSTFEDETPRAAQPKAVPDYAPSADPKSAARENAIDDPWAAWLLNLESAILPYSRIIVLAAVIAAMGLTFVLLSGGNGDAIEAPSSTPQVSIESVSNTLAVVDPTVDNVGVEPPLNWPAKAETKPDAGLRPIGEPAVAVTDRLPPSAFAAGPASAWRGPAGAKLSGEVLPLDSQRVDVASQPTYPQTTR